MFSLKSISINKLADQEDRVYCGARDTPEHAVMVLIDGKQ